MRGHQKRDCEFCPRHMTGYTRDVHGGRRFRVCSLCYHLMRREKKDPWPRANDRKDHRRAR